jgi:hypothetical protein
MSKHFGMGNTKKKYRRDLIHPSKKGKGYGWERE